MSDHVKGEYAYYCFFTLRDGMQVTTEARFRPEQTPDKYATYLAAKKFHTFINPDGSCTLVNMTNVMTVRVADKDKEDEYDD